MNDAAVAIAIAVPITGVVLFVAFGAAVSRPVRGSGGVVVGGLVVILAQLAQDGWLNENAGAVQAVAAVASLLATLVLLWLTDRQADAAVQSAKLAQSAAEASLEQQREATRPIIAFRIERYRYEPGYASVGGFDVEIVNVGPAPAIDVRVSVGGPMRYWKFHGPDGPLVLLPKGDASFSFMLDERRPFTNDADRVLPNGWEDAHRRVVLLQVSGDRDDPDQRPDDGHHAIVEELTRAIAGCPAVAVVRASYRDVGGRPMSAQAFVALQPSPFVSDDFDGNGAKAWFDFIRREVATDAWFAGNDVGPTHSATERPAIP